MAIPTKRDRPDADADDGASSENDQRPPLKRSASVYSNINGVPRTTTGRLPHLGLTDGELANRVVIVGHIARAELLASFLQPEEVGGKIFYLSSDRGYTTYTGLFNGVKMSVVAIGMGCVMVDFFIREARQIVQGPLLVVRFGTCGVLQEQVQVGTVNVASEGAVMVQRNYDAFPLAEQHKTGFDGYTISRAVLPDSNLTQNIVAQMREDLGEGNVVCGGNATADSFYGSQGRIDENFPDGNEGVIEEVLRRYPKTLSMEMETFMLFHLAQCARPFASVRVSGAAVNVANRITSDVVDGERLKTMEREGGKAIMKALVNTSL